MAEVHIHSTMAAYVAWTNTDLTEGRGHAIPLCYSSSQATARRLGKGKSVQGSDCIVTKEIFVRIKEEGCYTSGWLGPVNFTAPSKQDEAEDEKERKKSEVYNKARLLGLTDEDLELLKK